MQRKVIISKRAESKLSDLFDYLSNKWSIKVKNTFINKLDKSINIIKIKPEMFPKSRIESSIHKCVITKQTSLFYKFDNKNIYIITIFDTRQIPIKQITEM